MPSVAIEHTRRDPKDGSMLSPSLSRRLRALVAALVVLALWAAPAFAASPYGTFIPLPSSGLPANGDVSQVAVNAAGSLFATVYGDGVYLSTDGGGSFTKLAPPNFGMTNDIPNKEMLTMIVNALGEPIIGSREVGAQQGPYLFRLDWTHRTWVTASIPAGCDISTDGYDPTGAQAITLGNVVIPKQRRFPRHMTLDDAGTIWLGWGYIAGHLRSYDNGSSYVFTKVPVATTGVNLGIGPNMLYSFNFNPASGEYFYGTELIGFWHSTDGGNTWLPIDPTGTTVIGAHQNDYAVGFNKDEEPIFSNWGRTATSTARGDVFTILTRDGAEAHAANGLNFWQFNKQSTFYQFNGGDAIMRNIRVPGVGYNFVSGYSSAYYNNGVPNGGKQTVYLSPDGYNWVEADVNQPFVSPYCNSIWTDGTDVLVGGTGQVWKFVITPPANHLPQVTISGPIFPVAFGASAVVEGSATDADADSLSYSWHSRGPGHATFIDPSASSTTVTFDVAGDYVLTFTADDNHRTASASTIVHVQNQTPTLVSAATAQSAQPTQIDLSVLADDAAAEGGEPALLYTWLVTGAPNSAAVGFSANGTNAAKISHAVVNKPGLYTFTAVIQDTGGQQVTSTVSFQVNQVASMITVSPQGMTIANNGTQAFSGSAIDQFGTAIVPPPSFTWTASGGGAMTSSGATSTFTGDSSGTGTFTITAALTSLTGTASLKTVVNQPPSVTTPAYSSPTAINLPGGATLDVGAVNPDGFPAGPLTYTWSKVSGPGTVTFTPNGTATSAVATSFSQWGTYVLRVDISDGISTTSNNVTVVVNPDPTQPITLSFQEGANGYTGEVDLSISTQGRATYNNNNGYVVKGASSLYVQDTQASGGYAAETLVRFDNLALPPGSKLLGASFTLNFTTYTGGYAVTGRYLAVPWNAAAPQYNFGWLNRDTGLLWNTQGAQGDGTDLIAGKSFSFGAFGTGSNLVKTVALDLTTVRGWLQSPATNQGMILVSAVGKTGTVATRSEPVVARRPLLTLVYEAAVAQPAAASPSSVSGTSAALSVLGRDFPAEGGEASLTYTWSLASGPAPVAFSPNGTNAAKNALATFAKAGVYTLVATITDANGIPATSSIAVTVVPTPTAVAITPADPTMAADQQLAFTATATDQFGLPLAPQPSLQWSVSGGGTISAAGVFTPNGTTTGLFSVTAAAGSLSGSTSVTVVQNMAPVVNTVVASPSSFALPSATTLTADAGDPDSYPGNGLTYAWALFTGPGPVTFSPNNSAAAASSQASFTVAGSYTLRVTVSDGFSTTVGNVAVSVAPDPTTPITATFQQGVSGYTGEADMSISTQGRAAYNGNNGYVFHDSQLYVQDTANVANGFIAKGLIRFNQLGIASSAIVASASLTLTFSTYSTGYIMTGRYLLASWDPAAPQYKTGWVNRDVTQLWAVQGAAGDGTDLIASRSFGFAATTTASNQVRTVALDAAVVQSWLANAASNQGVILTSPTGLKGTFSSGTDATPSKRPLLTIVYHF
jgi:hypothetical protein